MIKYCLDKWNKNRKRLEEALAADTTINRCNYKYLVEMVVKHILNDDDHDDYLEWDAENITEIDDGDYQGTLLFLIHRDVYQPSEYEYLMTCVSYGSCSGCDTLKAIQDWDDNPPTPQQLKDYMELCKDLVTSMIKPYNHGWRRATEFEEVQYD